MTVSLPKRRRKVKSKARGPIRCPSHITWVRGHFCTINDPECSVRMEAAHVRIGTDGGTGMKPGDNWVIPLCGHHHAEQHQMGEATFERRHRINMKAIAEGLWRISPHGIRWRMENQ
jgi:hypothetical protein